MICLIMHLSVKKRERMVTKFRTEVNLKWKRGRRGLQVILFHSVSGRVTHLYFIVRWRVYMCFIQSCVHDCISSAPPRSQDEVKYARDTREMPKKSSALVMPSHWLGLTLGSTTLVWIWKCFQKVAAGLSVNYTPHNRTSERCIFVTTTVVL